MAADDKKAPEAAKPEAPKSKAKMGIYECVGNVMHDGKPYAPGDAIELSEKDAASLLAIGRIKG